MNNKKLFLIVLTVLLLGGSYLYFRANTNTNNSDEKLIESDLTHTTATSNWKTYSNEEYGFEFKYPPELQFKQNKINHTKNMYGESNSVETRIELTRDSEEWVLQIL